MTWLARPWWLAVSLAVAAPASAGPGDPFNGIDVSIIDKSTGSALVFQLPPLQNTSNDVEDEVFGVQASPSFGLPAGFLPAGLATRTITSTAASPITASSVVLSGNALGAFAPGGGPGTGVPGPNVFGGSMGLLGVWRLFGLGGVTLVAVPLDVIGLGGTTVVTGALQVTLRGAGWTTGQAIITGITNPLGGTPATVGLTGFDNRTALGAGTVRMISPLVISTPFGQEAHFLQMEVSFSVPEPGALGLLAVGFGSLLWLGCRRQRAGSL